MRPLFLASATLGALRLQTLHVVAFIAFSQTIFACIFSILLPYIKKTL